jgi:hypothetical protein
MSSNAPVFSPELLKILKIFLGISVVLVLVFSLFDGYRANNTGEDRSFRVADADKLYFLNLRAIHYDRELRREAGMTVYRHGKRTAADSLSVLFPAILLHPVQEEAYLYFELPAEEYPLQVLVKAGATSDTLLLELGGNALHKAFAEQLWPFLAQEAVFVRLKGGNELPIWSTEREKEVLNTILSDYFRLLNQPPR